MSRRHSSSRRRNYGRRQHEINERRPADFRRGDWHVQSSRGDLPASTVDGDNESTPATDGFRGAVQ